MARFWRKISIIYIYNIYQYISNSVLRHKLLKFLTILLSQQRNQGLKQRLERLQASFQESASQLENQQPENVYMPESVASQHTSVEERGRTGFR